MEKVVYLLVFDGLADWEPALITYELNTSNNIPVKTVGFDLTPVRTGGGLKVVPDVTLADVKPEDTRLFILPGAEMWDYFEHSGLTQLVLDLHKAGVPVAAICGATCFLGRTGLFDQGILHTSNTLESLQKYAPDYGAEAYYQDKKAVSDQGVITAPGNAPHEFAYQILKTLQVYPENILTEFAEFWNCRLE